MVALLLGEALRATSTWEVTTYTITLAVGWLADTVGRVCTGRRSVAMLAGKVARAADATERTGVVRVVTLLLALLILDLRRTKLRAVRMNEERYTHKSGEIVAGLLPTNSVDDLLCYRVAVKEPRKDGQAETDVKMSRNKVLACRIRVSQSGPASCVMPIVLRTKEGNIDIQIQSGTNINKALLRVSLPRLENVPGPRSIGHGTREEDRE